MSAFSAGVRLMFTEGHHHAPVALVVVAALQPDAGLAAAQPLQLPLLEHVVIAVENGRRAGSGAGGPSRGTG
ncbi:hypothetical protein EYF80_052392 [Liparis tanakae]|uniref:Uncharacterized protein n=1 Tax=Liparis tanakae TaxID=230148 RepID=A0A4Z2F8H2_9TELE|nr:hypothetical protein EYF80_052392 [Liparis tanakae]